MSRYAYLACIESKEYIWLGKAVFSSGNRNPSFFQLESSDSARNWENSRLNQLIAKFFAVNCGKELRVLLEDEIPDDFLEIGGDSATGITAKEYLDGWPGK